MGWLVLWHVNPWGVFYDHANLIIMVSNHLQYEKSDPI